MRLSLICWLVLMGSVLSASGKSIKGKKLRRRPIYRSLRDMVENVDAPTTTSAAEGSFAIGRSTGSDEGRLFKHFLLFKSLTDSHKDTGTDYIPYVIVNSPATLTNVNSNIIANNPTTATTTTGTGTGGAAVAGNAVRLQYNTNRNALPYAVSDVPTPIYHQRTQPLPQIIYGPPLKRINRKKNNSNLRKNPFSEFANNFKRIQFF